ncbi:MAG: hypothetical protein ABFD98_08820 [Syntrophobacteraceae bacterium]
MNWAWRMGMFIVAGVPAIVGGGLAWAFFESWTAVIVWEIVLIVAMILIVAKGGAGKEAGAGHGGKQVSTSH